MFIPTIHKEAKRAAYLAHYAGIPFTAIEFHRHTVTGEVILVRF